MYDPPDKQLYTIDQSLYSPGNPVCGPSPGPLSPPLNNQGGGQTTPQPSPSPHHQQKALPIDEVITATTEVNPPHSITTPFDIQVNFAPPGECCPATNSSGTGGSHNEELYDLAHALLKAEATGSRTAVVKEEIRHLIKKKRRISGYQPTDAEEGHSQEQSSGMTAQDEERKKRRKASNRKAAIKCRERKKEADEILKQNCVKLEDENKKLKAKVGSLEEQVERLNNEIKEHDRFCQLFPATSFSLTNQPEDVDQTGPVSSITSSSLSHVSDQKPPNTLSAETSSHQVTSSTVEQADPAVMVNADDIVSFGLKVEFAGVYNSTFVAVDRPAEALDTTEQPILELETGYLATLHGFPEQEVPQYLGEASQLPVINSDELQEILNL